LAAAVRLSPTMRAQLEAEMGEGGTLEQVGARLDLGRDLDVAIAGLVSTHQQAMDLVARLSTVLREQRNRPLILILGLQSIVDGVRLGARENRVEGRLSIPEDQRAEIVDRMALVAEQIARRRASTAGSGENSSEGTVR
jgi:response regulator RpfG family c-di-GMP phosphodiesterase